MKTKKILITKLFLCLALIILASSLITNVKLDQNIKTVKADGTVIRLIPANDYITGDEVVIENYQGTTYTLPFTVEGWTIEDGWEIMGWYCYENYDQGIRYLPGQTITLPTTDNGFSPIIKETNSLSFSSNDNDDIYWRNDCDKNSGGWEFIVTYGRWELSIRSFVEESAEGIFLLDNLNKSHCYIKNLDTDEESQFTKGSCEITIENGTVKFYGVFSIEGEEEENYAISITYSDNPFSGLVGPGGPVGPGTGNNPTNTPKKGGAGGVVAGLLVVVALLGGAYGVLFFAINKWIIVDGKVVRAFKLVKKDDENKLVTFKGKFENRANEQVFDSKEDAEKALKKTVNDVVEETKNVAETQDDTNNE